MAIACPPQAVKNIMDNCELRLMFSEPKGLGVKRTGNNTEASGVKTIYVKLLKSGRVRGERCR